MKYARFSVSAISLAIGLSLGGVAQAEKQAKHLHKNKHRAKNVILTIAGYPTRGNPILGKVVGNDSAGNANPHAQLAEGGHCRH